MNKVKQEQDRIRIQSVINYKNSKCTLNKTELECRTLASTFCKTLIWEITEDADGEDRVKVKSALNVEMPDFGDCSVA